MASIVVVHCKHVMELTRGEGGEGGKREDEKEEREEREKEERRRKVKGKREIA